MQEELLKQRKAFGGNWQENNLFALFSLLLAFNLSACHLSPQVKVNTGSQCTQDSDCVLVKKGCCGCASGGKMTAIHVSKQAEIYKEHALDSVVFAQQAFCVEHSRISV